MIAEELINQMIPALKPADSVEQALTWMEEFKVHQLPVVKRDEYLGLVSEDAILNLIDIPTQISQIPLICQNVKATYNQHFYEVLRMARENKVEMMAVLDEGSCFLGVVTVNDTLVAFSDSIALQEPGGILVLSLEHRDYSLTEISRLVESNDAKILSTYLHHDPKDESRLNVTLKINKTDLTHIISTFERFSYQIIAKFQTKGNEDLDKDRLDMLLKYLDI